MTAVRDMSDCGFVRKSTIQNLKRLYRDRHALQKQGLQRFD
tara:strand:+ start:178 stop:300 length:123 start_codon:yes stop_codon:yes gene_type:complete